MNNAITTLVGKKLEGAGTFGGALAAANGSVYGILAVLVEL